jgi:hypothetical protein
MPNHPVPVRAVVRAQLSADRHADDHDFPHSAGLTPNSRDKLHRALIGAPSPAGSVTPDHSDETAGFMAAFFRRGVRYLRYQLRRLARSPRIPFEVRARLYWWRQRGSWWFRRPSTFTAKLQWKRLRDRRPLLTTFADKAAVREYVAQTVGPELLTDCYAVVSDPRELNQSRLPREFVVKPTHCSGLIHIVSDRARSDTAVTPASARKMGIIMSTPEAVDWNQLVATSRRWLARNYGEETLEWSYRNIPPRILVEELLKQPDGQLAMNYRVFVFHGRARLVQVDVLQRDGWRCNHYLPDWSPVEVQIRHPPADKAFSRPHRLARMLEVAEALGRETDFVRVDLYEVEGRVVFGELTNYPLGGRGGVVPQWFDIELGRWWSPPRTYR